MNEKQTTATRPTKKQKELLSFIEAFINEHGYSPSYREVMNGLNYTSVATVALHINSLIKRGHLRKRDRSARSLEVVRAKISEPVAAEVSPSEEKWLVDKVERAFHEIEHLEDELKTVSLDNLYVLVGALKVLGLEAAAASFVPRISDLKRRQEA